MPATHTFPTRELKASDLDEVVRIDGLHTGRPQREYWEGVFSDWLRRRRRGGAFGLGADAEDGRLAGYLFAEVRAVEFGSDACGWVFAVGVDRGWLRKGVAAALLETAGERFREGGVTCVRTMVRRNDVPVLSFFRARGFVGGPYVQLELDLGERRE